MALRTRGWMQSFSGNNGWLQQWLSLFLHPFWLATLTVIGCLNSLVLCYVQMPRVEKFGCGKIPNMKYLFKVSTFPFEGETISCPACVTTVPELLPELLQALINVKSYTRTFVDKLIIIYFHSDVTRILRYRMKTDKRSVELDDAVNKLMLRHVHQKCPKHGEEKGVREQYPRTPSWQQALVIYALLTPNLSGSLTKSRIHLLKKTCTKLTLLIETMQRGVLLREPVLSGWLPCYDLGRSTVLVKRPEK